MAVTRIEDVSPKGAGAQLKKLRVMKGVRPAAVARATGLSPQRVNDIENKPGVSITLTTAEAYCKAIGIRIAFVSSDDSE